jgi:signal transduction histidine kinase
MRKHHKESEMALNKDQEDLYRKTMDEVKKQLDSIDSLVEQELQKVRETLAQLQESKKTLKMVYEGTARLLGIETEFEGETENEASPMAKM